MEMTHNFPAVICDMEAGSVTTGVVNAFLAETKSNGQRGLKVFALCVMQAEQHGNIEPLKRLVTGSCGLDARRFKALSLWYFADAIKVTSKGWSFKRKADFESRCDRALSLRSAIEQGHTFRGDAVAEMAGISTKEPQQFDMAKLAAAVAAKLKKNKRNASEFEAALQAAMKA